ncbi:MAG: metalloregulator ArsR/SmtB family transcription factor [Limnospira sp. PMC 1291.21]|uniref:Metalloregulator ArsR/SmtB family transcription factor n=1 Tax=Limnospira fusiformis PMC 851.14 TaxID=2219512 RepID=A0ABU9EIL2_LIMFS|nr:MULTISPECIES: metalloregulator ArsR/SmtB family transcription factor [Oscillatoriales]EKD07346.1 putative transcriptional regulator ArsR family [Arthrospira platensis C1]MDC0837056.1 metalloregulator ArsR/SmtB family transcription factor [Limnoraphis robusta]MDT9179157.1 metalloregulator ArsR/SmtB family transcription factor [Limnospira sp. PMC 1238.20]MDT9189735.1 metalloregulator ArsR/SmtB family transcription factor [Limnospira sp. PMC 894.15]MDT9286773.1 metalloregulator ArsR/SmtB famil
MTKSSVKASQFQLESNSGECGVSKLPPEALTLMADFFKVLSEVSRLQIVCCLKTGAKNVTQIIEATGLGQANVSKHLKMLAQAGIVTRRQQGVNVYYEIANPFLFELCELVCDSLSVQINQQNKQFEKLRVLQEAF